MSLGSKGLTINLTGLVISVDGKTPIRVSGEGSDALQLGEKLAGQALSQGANEILASSGVK
jgi:hypothetical protein